MILERMKIVSLSKNHTPINKYKPTGQLLYNPELFDAMSRVSSTGRKP